MGLSDRIIWCLSSNSPRIEQSLGKPKQMNLTQRHFAELNIIHHLAFDFFSNRILPAVLIRTKSIYCLKSWQLNANILLQLLEMSSPCLNKKQESFNYCKFVLAESVRRS